MQEKQELGGLVENLKKKYYEELKTLENKIYDYKRNKYNVAMDPPVLRLASQTSQK